MSGFGKSVLFLASLVVASATQPSSAATYTAADSAGLTSLLSSTVLGDTIVLNASQTYTGTFTLPVKSGSGYVTIQSSALGSLPAAGTRVNMSHAGNMPNIVPGNAGSSAIQTAAGAHHYKLIGLEIISFTTTSAITNDLVLLGSTTYTSSSPTPHNIVIDRCIIRASTSSQAIKRGIGLHSASTDITNCYIAGFKVSGQDSQAIGGINGPGPYNIINNYLEGAAENVLFGGDVIRIPNNVPSDITIKKNHFNKPKEWNKYRTAANGFSAPLYDGSTWTIKNLLEFKNAQRVIVEGNIFENHWIQAQPGWALVYTPRSENGLCPWVVVQDVEYSKNILRDVSAGGNFMGRDDSGPSEQTKNLQFIDNLSYNIGGLEFGGGGKFFQVLGDTANFTLKHNTTFYNGSSWISASGISNPGYVMTNNIFPRKNYGIIHSGFTWGENTLTGAFPGVIFTKNVIEGGPASSWDAYNNNFSPISLGYPTGFTTVLTNYPAPGSNFAGWKVINGSAYDNSGLKNDLTADGRDVGCDIDALNAATAGCVSGVWPTALIAQESFVYTGNLNGKNGGIGFGTNAWTAVSGQADPVLATGSMPYTDGTHSIAMLVTGNKVQPANTSQSTRNFPATIPTANRALWLSMRMNHTGTGTLPTNHAGISLYSGTNGSGTGIFFGKPGFSATNYGIDHSGTWVQKTGAVTAADRNAFLVYKMVFTATQVTVSMWINPILSEGALGTPHATVTKAHTTGFASMRISTGANATGFQFDEWKLGSGFQDVTD